MLEYMSIAQFVPMKGFFRKRPAGVFPMFIIIIEDLVLIFQVLERFLGNEKFYLTVLSGFSETPDENRKEEIMDQFRYSNEVDMLEQKIPIKADIRNNGNIEIILKKPSKIIKDRKLKFFGDSRLPQFYYLLDTKLSDKVEPRDLKKDEPVPNRDISATAIKARAVSSRLTKKFL